MTESCPPEGSVRVTFGEMEHPSHQSRGSSPPAYGDEAGSTLAIPVNRLSESSRSDGSGEHGVYATTTTTTHTVHTTTTFFRLTRRKPGPLFPLPPKVTSSDRSGSLTVLNPPPSVSSQSPEPDSAAANSEGSVISPPSSPFHTALPKSSVGYSGPGSSLVRNLSDASTRSSPSRSRLGVRGRSSTLSSLRNMPSDDPLPTPTLPSTRTSTSTGRKSLGDLLSLSHRLRQNSEPPFPKGNSGPATPGSGNSKNNSVQLSREPVVIPERQEEETPAKYLVRLEEAVSRGVVASVLSRGSDQFSQQVLRSYMRGFGFFGDPMDMAIRKLLMEVELPKETQQIDRCLQGFANRYHECNPGIYASPDQAYFIAFSLLILHTDVFNKNNKHKMQKSDYIKNTQGEGIFDEILECFYDNICYTPFIHVEDDLDINGERIVQHKMKKKSIFPRSSSDPTKRPSKEPVDPYTLIIDNRLDVLRPNLKEVMYLDEPYNYLGTAQSLNLQDLQKTFFRTGVLQIVSARSRPDAFMSEKTATNPEDAHPGIVDIKITKVGLLWRKDAKKKKTRSPWQEWGAILTGAQLYFFRNTAWIKNLMHQLESHIKQGHDGIPVIFKPPLEQFKPDALMSTDDAVALMDSTYKKHKNAFLFVRHGGIDEVFLADNEDEMNDWMAKLNYAAAFRTSGVRMRGVVGGNYEGQRTRGIRRLDSNGGARSVQTPTGEVTIISGKIDAKMAQDILAARREIMLQKISQAEEKLTVAQKQLDDNLRNARHLQILAPIQAKTRERVLSAAAHMAAKLKWIRVEIWRMRCHRDILMMDLEEERKTESISAPQSVERNSLGRLDSKTSTVLAPHRSPRSTNSRPSTQPTSENDKTFGMEDVFTTPPLTSGSNFHKAQPSWELPPPGPEARRGRHSSLSNSIPRSPPLPHTSSFPGANPASTVENVHGASTPQVDAEEQVVLEEAGLLNSEPSPDGKGTDTGPSGPDSQDVKEWTESAERERVDRGKIIRRSLHRTLREAHAPSHQRSRKGKEFSSGVGMSDEAHTDDALSRGSGSFVVHGKKASVITFGDEFNSMSPDERLKLRKMGHRDESAGIIVAVAEDDSQPALPRSVEHEVHRGSAASTNTATARSFRELHRRLSSHTANLGVTSLDGDDSEAAVSFSDGRRTPLPPVEDLEEGDQSPGSAEKQATLYTPEAATTPTNTEYEEKDTANGKAGPASSGSLPSPVLQLVSA
jgi:Sec7 domain/PH domain